MRPLRALTAAASTVLLAYALTSCGGGGDEVPTLRVHAASSLDAPFAELVDRFVAERAAAGERVEVQLDLAGSADLVARIEQGAPGDVLVTADTASMERLDAALLAAEPRVVATNTLALVVPTDNPARIASLADATAPGVRLVACAPRVPCGDAAARLAAAAGVTLRPVSEERAVVDVLGKVRSGEADAGLVYRTEVGDDVSVIEVPEASGVVNAYPVARLADSDHPRLAEAFVDLLLGPVGRETLQTYGFGAP